jgi:histidinol-phosphate aminotransferase
LRRLVADHVGVPEESVVLGPGASGLAIQVLHAMTNPGDRIVLSQPTFDGYPIFARMAQLTTVEIPLDRYGRHDLAAMARAAADARVVEYAVRRMARTTELLRPAMGALADRHFSPLTT